MGRGSQGSYQVFRYPVSLVRQSSVPVHSAVHRWAGNSSLRIIRSMLWYQTLRRIQSREFLSTYGPPRPKEPFIWRKPAILIAQSLTSDKDIWKIEQVIYVLHTLTAQLDLEGDHPLAGECSRVLLFSVHGDLDGEIERKHQGRSARTIRKTLF